MTDENAPEPDAPKAPEGWGHAPASGRYPHPLAGDSEATREATTDPWKSFRAVMAGTLILEAIVVLLALPVVAVADGGLRPRSVIFLVGLAVVLVLLAGVQGRPWAIWVNLAMQLVVIAGVVVHGAIGFIGVLFAAVWLLIAYLRAEVKRREKRGLLPGQQRYPHPLAGESDATREGLGE
jgi:hypothetical protein